jgi:predicted ATPase
VIDFPTAVLERIVARAEGVPYFAEEMVNWFIDRGIIDTRQQPWRFAAEKLDEAGLPTTLQHLLLTRISALADDLRYTLQCGSIFGRSFWEGGVAALGVEDPSVVAALQPRGFVDAQLESSLAGEHEWSFHHNLLRDVTYDSVLKRQRPELHRLAAAWLEEQARRADRLDEFAGLLGEHNEKAAQRQPAASWFLRAGSYASQRGASQTARRFYDRALTLAPYEETWLRWEILLGRSEVLGTLGESGPRQADISALLSLAQELGDLNCLAEAESRRAWMLATTGDESGAVQAFERAAAIAQQAGNLEIEAAALSTQTVSLTRLGDFQAAERAAQRALSIAARLGSDKLLGRAYVNISHYYTATGDLSGGAEMLEKAVEIYHRIGNLGGEAASQTNLGYSYMQLGDYPLSLSAMQSALKQAQAIGDRLVSGYSRLNQGLILVRLGDWQAALDLLAISAQDLAAYNDQFGLAAKSSYDGLAYEAGGKLDEAIHGFSHARQNFEALGVQTYALDATAGLARCMLAAGDLQGANQPARQVWEYIAASGIHGLELPIWDCLSCVQVFQALGDEQAAHQALMHGYQHLMERAAAISDRSWRQSYLEHVPEHQVIVSLYNQTFQTKGETIV